MATLPPKNPDDGTRRPGYPRVFKNFDSLIDTGDDMHEYRLMLDGRNCLLKGLDPGPARVLVPSDGTPEILNVIPNDKAKPRHVFRDGREAKHHSFTKGRYCEGK